jgi:hypothetical protein
MERELLTEGMIEQLKFKLERYDYEMTNGDSIIFSMKYIAEDFEIVDERIDFEKLSNHEVVLVWHQKKDGRISLKQITIIDVAKGPFVMLHDLLKKWEERLGLTRQA